MKRISFLLIIFLIIAACNNSGTTSNDAAENEGAGTELAAPAEASIEVAIIDVTGMHCDGCVNAITNALNELEGVEQAKVSLEYEQAKVKFETSKVTTADLQAAIESKGYGVGGIEIVKPENQPEEQTQ